MTPYIKEKYNISNKAYNELSMVNKNILWSCTLCMCTKELDTHSQIKLTPGQAHCVQQSLTMCLKKRIEVLLQKNPAMCDSPHIWVKSLVMGLEDVAICTVVIAFVLIEGNVNASREAIQLPSRIWAKTMKNWPNRYKILINSLKIITVDDIIFSIEFFWVLTWNFWLLLLEFKVQMLSIHVYGVSYLTSDAQTLIHKN